jgi:EAL and modified HD-GYP domain-containing signal transduction protein
MRAQRGWELSREGLMERILVSRQPIFGSDMSKLGYELLFRNSDEDRASFSDGDQATAEVIVNTFMEIGLDEMVGRHLAFINFDRNLILGSYCECLPRDRVVLEILKSVELDAAILQKLRLLRANGYRIALENPATMELPAPLLEVASFVKFDLTSSNPAALGRFMNSVRKYGVQLVAEKVETREQFLHCQTLGFDYFQGYFFCRPELIQGKRPPVSRLATIRLITKLNNPEFNVKDLEQAISQDVSLSYKLLRYMNSAMYCLQKPVTSIGHAIMLIGQERMRLWASLILFSKFEDRSHDIIVTGAVRGRMCEYLARTLRIAQPERLFLVGLFSVLDAILDSTMEQALSSLPLERPIIDALLRQQGELGPVLRCVLAYEKRDWKEAAASVALDQETIRTAYRNAVAWSLTTLNGFYELHQVKIPR